MKNLLLLFSVLCICAKAQTFQATYGDTGREEFSCMKRTFDKGFIMAGFTGSYTAGLWDAYLVKTDSVGALQWSKKLGGNAYDVFYYVLQTSDSGYIAAGASTSFEPAADVFMARYDKNGTLLWSKNYGGSGGDVAYFIKQIPGGFFVASYSASFGAGGFDFHLAKLSSSGNIIWTKTYGGTGDEVLLGAEVTADGGLIMTGYTSSYGAGLYDIFLVKTDSLGALQWSKAYGGTDYELAYAVKQTLDGGYIVAGTTLSFGFGMADGYLLKTDASGTLLWSKTYGGSFGDEIQTLDLTPDGGYILGGSTESFGNGAFDALVVKTDISGVPVWSKCYGGSSDEMLKSVAMLPNGGYAFLGNTFGFGQGGYDGYLINTDTGGNTFCNDTIPLLIFNAALSITSLTVPTVSTGGTIVNSPSITGSGCIMNTVCNTTGFNELNPTLMKTTIYPNPSNGLISIQSSTEISTIEITNVLGELIYASAVDSFTAEIDLSAHGTGLFFYTVKNGKDIIGSGKFIVR